MGGGGNWSRGRKPTPPEEDSAPLGAVPDDLPKPKGIENMRSPPFGLLVNLFSAFENPPKKKTGYKDRLLKEFFVKWREEVGPDLYPVLRLMLPDRDNRRRTYQLKEAKIAKAYISALDLPPFSSDASKLLNWKTPTQKDPGAGEFSTVAYEVIRTRSTVVSRMGDMTIDDVNSILDQLRQSVRNSDEKKTKLGDEHARILKVCTQRMTADEQKWFIRIILRDLKVGMGERGVFQAMHPDAMELFNTCSDILRVCWKLFDVAYRLPNEDTDVTPGSVFRPMLCHRNQRNLEDIIKTMAKGRPKSAPGVDEAALSAKNPYYFAPNEFIIEEKLDGERIQLHKIGKKYQYHSRKSKDYTYLYGATPSTGSLTPFIHNSFHESVEDVILDGEMIVWDPALEKYMPFGNLKTYAAESSFGDLDPRPCFKVFDILYIKNKAGFGQRLIDKPLRERKELLSKIIKKTKQGVFELAPIQKATSAKDLQNYLNYILETRGEGMCVKNPESFYILGGRQDTWVKVKPEYMDELGENVDVLVIGGFWGQGRRAGRMSSFMVGLRDTTKKEVDGEPCFLSFAKVGTGFNLEAYNMISKLTEGKWIEYDKKKITPDNKKGSPRWFKTVTEYPDVFLAPSDSFVIEIKAAEIVGGAEYGAGMTLRFPRAIKLRDDRDAENCMTVEDVQKFRGSGNKRAFGDDLRGKNKMGSAGQANKKARSISAPLGRVEKVSGIFKGFTFYVHRGAQKETLQKAVAENGGSFIQKIPDPSVPRFVIAEKYEGIKSKAGAKAADILFPSWVLDSIKAGQRLPLLKQYYVHALPATEASDEYNGMEEDFEDDAYDLCKVEEEDDPVEEDTKPSFALANWEPSASYRDDSEKDADDLDEEAESDREDGGWRKDDDDDDDDDDESDSGDGPVDPSADVGMDGPEDVSGPLQGLADVDLNVDPQGLSGAPPGMGAGLGEQHFDPDLPFAPYVCYFDTTENAASNDLPPSIAPLKDLASKGLKRIEKEFVQHGGTSTQYLEDPKLTHIVVDLRIKDRWKEMISKTSQPRNRRLVHKAWISDTIEAGEGPMDPEDYGA